MSLSISQLLRIDAGLFVLRLTGCLLLFHVHSLPQVFHLSVKLTPTEDPFDLCPYMSLMPAAVTEVICPVFILAGVFTRLACLPVIGILLVKMMFVHSDWGIADGRLGWLLLIIFTILAITGPGKWRLGAGTKEGVRYGQG